jgi:Arm DNA-binding domain
MLEKLSPAAITRKAEYRKPGRYADGGGLYLQVTPKADGEGVTRAWLFQYSWQGRVRQMGLGSFVNVSLAQARKPSREAIELLAARNDVHFNAGELARDLIYATEAERDNAHRFHLAHSLRKDRRGQMMVVCLGLDGQTTSYSGPRSADSRLVAYPCKSKMDKRHPALHIEERSSQAARSLAGASAICATS